MENLDFLNQYRNPKTGRLKHGTLKLLTPEQLLQYQTAYSVQYYRERKRKTLDKPLRKYVKYSTKDRLPCPTCEIKNCKFVPE